MIDLLKCILQLCEFRNNHICWGATRVRRCKCLGSPRCLHPEHSEGVGSIRAPLWQVTGSRAHTQERILGRENVTAIFRQAQAMAKSNQAYGEQPEEMTSGLFPGPLPGTALLPKKRRAQISTHNNPHSAQLPRGSEQIPAEQTLYLTSFVHPGAVPASGEQEE